MHKLVLDELVKTCRQRSKTNSPIAPACPRETLEEAIVDLANQLESLGRKFPLCDTHKGVYNKYCPQCAINELKRVNYYGMP